MLTTFCYVVALNKLLPAVAQVTGQWWTVWIGGNDRRSRVTGGDQLY